MAENLADEARHALQLANQEAHRLQHEYIGTEHLLLGLIKGCSQTDSSVLMYLDIDPGEIIEAIENIIERGPDFVSGAVFPLTPRARRALEFAVSEAETLEHEAVDREHLLLGLLREREGVAARVLLERGLCLEVAREKVRWWRNAIDTAWLRWNDNTVTFMAHSISTGRTWADLPALADAMEEAGCDDAEILACLRDRPKEGKARAILNLLLSRADMHVIASIAPKNRWWQIWK